MSSQHSPNEIEIVPVDSDRLRREFEELPEDLHGGHPIFAPPLPGSVSSQFGPKSQFARHHGCIAGFLARRNGKAVGRIAGIVNRSHNQYHNDRVGFFGYFSCIHETRVAGALFDAVREMLRRANLDTIRGPYNPSINDESGVLVEGFDRDQVAGLPWNPDYYATLVESAGLSPARTLFGFHLPLREIGINQRVQRIADRMAARSKFRVRPINMNRIEEDLEVIREVYNDTLKRNWGFVPISSIDLRVAASGLRAIAEPTMMMVAEQGGRTAGVAISLPNLDTLLHRTKRTPRFLRMVHLLYLIKFCRPPICGRFVVYGILPEFRDRGLHGWLLGEQFRRAREIWEWAQLGWIEETNVEVLESSRLMGGVQNKVWKVYEAPL